MSFTADITDPGKHEKAARELLNFAGTRRILLFDAPMGAGKTTFITALCKALGSDDAVTSPTFSIVHEYSSPAGPIYHFDLYRVTHVNELYDIGVEEYLDSGNYCFVEWPEKMRSMADDAVEIRISYDHGRRMLSASEPQPR